MSKRYWGYMYTTIKRSKYAVVCRCRILGVQIGNFRYANMDFFKTPHIQIWFLGKDPVFKYEFLVLFSHPCIMHWSIIKNAEWRLSLKRVQLLHICAERLHSAFIPRLSYYLTHLAPSCIYPFNTLYHFILISCNHVQSLVLYIAKLYLLPRPASCGRVCKKVCFAFP